MNLMTTGLVIGALGVAQAIIHRQGVPAPVRDGAGVVIGTPLAPAKLTQDQAVAIAKASGWGTMLAQGTGMTVRFGSWVSGYAHIVSPAHVQDNAAQDTWAITVGGLNEPPHLPIGVTLTPSLMRHFLTVFVDDTTRQEIMAKIY